MRMEKAMAAADPTGRPIDCGPRTPHDISTFISIKLEEKKKISFYFANHTGRAQACQDSTTVFPVNGQKQYHGSHFESQQMNGYSQKRNRQGCVVPDPAM
jgi:hypothetical protein